MSCFYIMFEINDFKNLFIESSIIQRLIFKFFLILEQYDESLLWDALYLWSRLGYICILTFFKFSWMALKDTY